jgi:hypothetical protein
MCYGLWTGQDIGLNLRNAFDVAGDPSQRSIWTAASVALHAKAIVLASEMGRAYSNLCRGSFLRHCGRRYMWWGVNYPKIICEEKQRAWRHCLYMLVILFVSAVLCFWCSGAS